MKIRKMSRHLTLTIFLVTTILTKKCLSDSCDENVTETITYKSLQDYHYYPNAFNRNLSKTFKGNSVKFSTTFEEGLRAGAFAHNSSDHLLELLMENTNITDIEEGTFLSLLCLNKLVLRNNFIRDISATIFAPLIHLRHLDLSHNFLKLVVDRPFEGMQRLSTLDLSDNLIRGIDDDSFTGNGLLYKLNLANNHLEEIENKTFSYLVSLETLYLNGNRLLDPVGVWPSWVHLSLANNYIQYFGFGKMTSSQLDFEYKLSYVNLSCNFITDVNTSVLIGDFYMLDKVDINNNLFRCSELSVILHNFYDARVDYPRIEFERKNLDGVFCEDEKKERHPCDYPPGPFEDNYPAIEDEMLEMEASLKLVMIYYIMLAAESGCYVFINLALIIVFRMDPGRILMFGSEYPWPWEEGRRPRLPQQNPNQPQIPREEYRLEIRPSRY